MASPVYIYKIINTVNSKIYVGLTSNLNRRWSQHKINSIKNSKNSALYKSMNKYGIDKFELIPICKCLNYKVAGDVETELIRHYNSLAPNGYNIQNGGIQAYEFKHPENFKKVMSERMKGENNPFYGKKHSKETIEKMKTLLKSRVYKPKTMESKLKGIPRTDEVKRKISEAQKGKIISEEAKKNLSLALSKVPVDQFTKNGEFVQTWLSAHQVVKELGIYHVARVCRGERKYAGGFIWRFSEKIKNLGGNYE